MSVGEEQNECPLCMEPLELDDINFFPCTCGYQICRFCWHRIRTDENGLCPACRKQYPEDPAEFKPLTEDELQRIKKERRQKDLQRKQKAAENRKHLANVRVVQKNLVFVVGLSQRLADPEVLKKPEYFGKFGKIHKVVINHSTSYAGAQVRKADGPSASAYVTYVRPEDALRAIQAVNNIYVDGRNLKASLGTTKYCSHFLRGAQCPKPDCMYLHELGEEAASFTKEEMQQGKHQEYEQKLYEQFMNNQNLNHTQPAPSKTPPVSTTTQPTNSRKKSGSPQTVIQSGGSTSHVPPSTSKDAWPSLGGHKAERLSNGTRSSKHGAGDSNRAPGHHRNKESDLEHSKSKAGNGALPGRGSGGTTPDSSTDSPQSTPPPMSGDTPSPSQSPVTGPQILSQSAISGLARKAGFDPNGDNPMSLFCNSGFPSSRQPKPHIPHTQLDESSILHTEIPDTIPVSSTTDWQAAFGFSSSSTSSSHSNHMPHSSACSETHDDDLGFDPWDESTKALADLIEKEQQTDDSMMSRGLPPGFSPTHIGAYTRNLSHMGMGRMHQPPLPASAAGASKMMGLMQFPPPPPGSAAAGGLPSMPSFHGPPPPLHGHYHHMMSDFALNDQAKRSNHHQQAQSDLFNMKDWQDGLRALLPNINISFGGPPSKQQQQPPSVSHSAAHSNMPADLCIDPAIVTSGKLCNHSYTEEPPHWMASLHHLTEDTTHNSRLPFLQQMPFREPEF